MPVSSTWSLADRLNFVVKAVLLGIWRQRGADSAADSLVKLNVTRDPSEPCVT
jgi:hypothetical protein